MKKRSPFNTAVRRILAGAAEVHVIDQLSVLNDPDAPRITVTGPEIAELTRLLAVGGMSTTRYMGWGQPTVLVLGPGGEELARWDLHGQERLRGPENHEAWLLDGPALTTWLADRGLTGPREEQEEAARDEILREERRVQWVRAAPKLVYLADPVSLGEPGAEERLAASMPRVYPDPVTRIRNLLTWAGFSCRQGDGFMGYEHVPQRLLLTEPPEAIFDALLAAPLTPEQRDGAAALFASHPWSAPVPEAVRAQLEPNP